ncbi:MAG: hypothetical protein IJD37_07925, partial [Clostridia bacterium]|nr:hypothetical protein [Clostridia bacterium]
PHPPPNFFEILVVPLLRWRRFCCGKIAQRQKPLLNHQLSWWFSYTNKKTPTFVGVSYIKL